MTFLYIVATPIGNLEDVTFRAIRILKEVNLILCEDTRVTRRLLRRYDIATSTESLNARSEDRKIERVVELLNDGKDIALVSDAGTPTISDPGALLVSRIREACPEVTIIPIPGPSALTTALSVAGVKASDFLFLGFLPHKRGRETLYREIITTKRTVVLYESPHRILKTLDRLSELLSAVGSETKRKVVVLRELTKIYEEIVSGTATEVSAHFKEYPSIKGEIVLIIEAEKK
ncbi:MAG: 16S rRNA (cytidine(1402)-2'-O)-methyltransferase [Candidatus Paceibacterota bacterium]